MQPSALPQHATSTFITALAVRCGPRPPHLCVLPHAAGAPSLLRGAHQLRGLARLVRHRAVQYLPHLVAVGLVPAWAGEDGAGRP